VNGGRSAPARRCASSSRTVLTTLDWLGPARDRAGMPMTQLRLHADPRVVAVLEAFERPVHGL
jgi:hypothetical protein